MRASALSLLLMLTACAAPAADGSRPNLPPRALIVAEPVPVPEVRIGQDPVAAAGEARRAAAENARRLAQSGDRYDRLRASYAN